MTDAELILAIDQGTQSSRAILFDQHGNQLASSRRKISLNRIDRHHVEQDGMEIITSVQECIHEIQQLTEIDTSRITVAGLATQRSSVIAWDKHTGEALSPVLSWQDRRAWQWIEKLAPHAREILQRSGLRLTPHYGASKLHWLLHNNDAVKTAMQQQRLLMGPLAAFLIANLIDKKEVINNHVDHANASRTQVWNLHTRKWDEELLRLFDLPVSVLPAVTPICSDFGTLTGTNIKLKAVNGDQTAALYSQGELPEKTVLVNIGTGAFVLLPTHQTIHQHPRLLSGLSDSDDNHQDYLIEGTVNGAGAALQWCSNNNIDTSPAELSHALLDDRDQQLLFMNTIGGLGSPWWKDGPDAHWTTLSGEVVNNPEPGQALVAVAESILFLIMKNIETMLDSGLQIKEILVSGGLSRQDQLCQRLATLAQLPVHRSIQSEATSKGIAWLAYGRPFKWLTDESMSFWPQEKNALHHRYQQFCSMLGANLKQAGIKN